MSSTDPNDQSKPKKESLLDRIEERRIKGGDSQSDPRSGQEPHSTSPPVTQPFPPPPSPEEPVNEAFDAASPESSPSSEYESFADTAPHTPEQKSGGLLGRLSSAHDMPAGDSLLPPTSTQPAIEEIHKEDEELPDFLQEFEDAFADQEPDRSQSIFDESLPISPEEQQMMMEADESSSEIETPPSAAPFSGASNQVAFVDATPSGDRVMGAKVDEAMERLREKMAKVAMEFAEGKINQAQFQAIYNRYQERRIITEQLLARDPTTDAWQQVLTEGHTMFLRSQFEARVMGYTLHDKRTGKIIVAHGDFGLSAEQLAHLIRSFYSATTEVFGGGMRSTVVEDGRWVVFVPGDYTTGIMVFSLQPSEGQLRLVKDLHQDFEHANEPTLASGNIDPDALVYPQRFLL